MVNSIKQGDIICRGVNDVLIILSNNNLHSWGDGRYYYVVPILGMPPEAELQKYKIDKTPDDILEIIKDKYYSGNNDRKYLSFNEDIDLKRRTNATGIKNGYIMITLIDGVPETYVDLSSRDHIRCGNLENKKLRKCLSIIKESIRRRKK